MIALIDIGNTKIKIKTYENNTFKNSYDFLTDDILTEKDKFEIIDKIDLVLYSSVVSEVDNIIKKYFKVKCIEVKENKLKQTFFYENIKNIGSDIIANFYGSLNYKLKHWLIISLGTATTISVIKNNKLVDCVIQPGLLTSLEGLAIKVKGFKINTNLNNCNEITKNLIIGHKHMINGFIKDFNCNNIIMTGGYLKYFKNEFNFENVIKDELLTFKGIIKINEI
ncbi:type III pantothenate kinase [Spiroplasma endosymbiont of Crioceris asparagi]|uniref:type III pantothenate kinase n=1 Tax=Spiroplasma endosymbiont of Crioceris asparagi TaxID=3066286 RepID=UPI0030CB648C